MDPDPSNEPSLTRPPEPPERRARPGRVWRRLRLAFRLFRIAVLSFVLLLLVAFLYFSQVGLPGFVKEPLLTELRLQGADLAFDRLRWRWYRGFVAEGVRFGFAASPDTPRVEVSEVALNLHWMRLLRERRLEVESLELRGGRLVVPLHEPGEAPEHFYLDQIGALLRFASPGEWDLDELHAGFLGATFRATGQIRNPSHLRSRAGTSGDSSFTPAQIAAYWRARLRGFLHLCQRMHFASAPDFRVRFLGDARDPLSFTVELRCTAAGASTPWISFADLTLTAEMNQPPPTNGWLNATLHLNVDNAQTPWARFQRATFQARLAHPATNLTQALIDWELSAEEAQGSVAAFRRARIAGQTRPSGGGDGEWQTAFTLTGTDLRTDWGQARTQKLSGSLTHVLRQGWPLSGTLEAELGGATTPHGSAEHLRVSVQLAPSGLAAVTNAAWARWGLLAPARLNFSLQTTNLHRPDLHLPRLSLAGAWDPPTLILSNLQVQAYGGTLIVTDARLDVDRRTARADLVSDLDAHQVAPLLGEGAKSWLDQFAWNTPPSVRATASATLPPWTNTAPDWPAQVLPSLVLDATVRGEDASYHGVAFTRAELAVSLSNQVLRLQDLMVRRPEGEARLQYQLHTRTREFRWQIDGNLDPKAVGPAIDSDADRLSRFFEFNHAVQVRGSVWGSWAPPRPLHLDLDIVATNFWFKGEPIDELTTGLSLHDQYLAATNLSVRIDPQWIRAPWVGVDLRHPQVALTNLEAEIDPARVARAIGSNVVATLSPYQFDQPPRLHVTGRVPVAGELDDADLRVELMGGPFHYWRFNLPRVGGTVHWRGPSVIITNLEGEFYQGRVQGDLALQMRTNGTADFGFRLHTTQANLRQLLADTIPTSTNRIEGWITGTLNVTHANSADWKSWQGNGQASMEDGLLWDLPVFSLLSPVLNAIAPGLGNNRATAAKGSYIITNSVIHTDDLEIKAGAVRLHYKGNVDFDANVRARVEAEMLASTPILGPILSLAFSPVTKILIFKVTGTLADPEIEPVYVPKFLLPVLSPFQTIRSLFPSSSDPGSKNQNRAP